MAELPHPSHPTDLRSLEQLVVDWPDPVFVVDSGAEHYLFVNSAAVRLIGYSREEILKLRPGDLSHPDDARELPSVLAQAERDGWVRRPWRGMQKDGSIVQAELTLFRHHIDGRDLLQGILRVEDDEVMTTTVDGKSDDVAAILDRTSLAVVTLDRDGVVTSWNAAAVERFQLTVEEAVGRQVLDLARSDQDRADVESLMRPHQQRDEWVSRLTIRRPDDEYEAMVTCSAIRTDEGELSGFLLITAPIEPHRSESSPRMRRARVQCAACGREVAGTMRRKYCSEKCRQWAYYHRHLDAQRERSRLRHERRRDGTEGDEVDESGEGAASNGNGRQ
jgi:PAS domain S-box-containing protein